VIFPLSEKSAVLAASVWDNRIADGGHAATVMIKKAIVIGERAGHRRFFIGLATTDYSDY
jgi:hypothetical protein